MTASGAADWITVYTLHEGEDARRVTRALRGAEAALMRPGAGVHAVGNLSLHRGGQLGDGTAGAGPVARPLHSWDFGLATGISPDDPRNAIPLERSRVRHGAGEAEAATAPPGAPGHLLAWTRRGVRGRGVYGVQRPAAGDGLATFLRGGTAPIVGHARIRGRARVAGPGPDDLASLDLDVARATGLEWVP
ncbi:MAG: hypothetical protein AB1416_13185 [Actinomycetota bacterium]